MFHYYFFEDIQLHHPFFSEKANKEIITRGYIEFISLKISAIAPFYYINKAMYSGATVPLDITYLEQFKNNNLEKKYHSIKEVMMTHTIHEVDDTDLTERLPSVKLDDYDVGEVTYKNYLFE
ncbi:hypothetical protein ACYSNR_06920 [Enterococcus sp. LJL128]